MCFCLLSDVILLMLISLLVSADEESCKIHKENDNIKSIPDFDGQKNTFSTNRNENIEKSYYKYYADLEEQALMMRDEPRTSAYQKAILENPSDFKGKIVMDLGTGSGILAAFAIQAGAKRVYAVEQSPAAHVAKVILETTFGNESVELVESAGECKNVEGGDLKLVRIILGKVENIGRKEVPEDIDILISEPIGQMLFNERMLESFVHAKRFFGTNKVKLFPTKADLHFAPFRDDMLFENMIKKTMFWKLENFYGINLSKVYQHALELVFKKTICGSIETNALLSPSGKYELDFETLQETDLHNINIPFMFKIEKAGLIHGLAFWFDIKFEGTDKTSWLSTSPWKPKTHWTQSSVLLKNPIRAKIDDTLSGQIAMRVHEDLSYYIDIDMDLHTSITRPNGDTQKVTRHVENHNIDMRSTYLNY